MTAKKNLPGRLSVSLLPAMRTAMTEAGYTRITELWRDFKVAMEGQQQDIALSYQRILDLSNGEGVCEPDGDAYTRSAELMAAFLGAHPQDLFGALPSDPHDYDVDPDHIPAEERDENFTQPEDHVLQRERAQAIGKCLDQLAVVDEKGAEAIRLRYGLANGIPLTLGETAEEMGMTAERVRHLEARATARLRALITRQYARVEDRTWTTVITLNI